MGTSLEGESGCLELLTDPDMEEFFTEGIRGGQSFISQRKAEGEKDPERGGWHLLYIDGRWMYVCVWYGGHPPLKVVLSIFFSQ